MQLKKQIESLLVTDHPIWVWGKPGIGKSQIIKQIADEQGIGFIDVRACIYDPLNIIGIPVVQNNRTVFMPVKEFMPTEGKGIINLDELASASEDTQKVLLQFCLEKQLGGETLPEGWKIVAASNDVDDSCGDVFVIESLLNRFLHLKADVDYKDWLAWAEGAGIHEHIRTYIDKNPEMIMRQKEENEKAFPTPRTWEMANKIYSVDNTASIAPAVGNFASGAFESFIYMLNNEPEAILDEDKVIEEFYRTNGANMDKLSMVDAVRIIRDHQGEIRKLDDDLVVKLNTRLTEMAVEGDD